jgi:RND superfamily putative drug exporter
MQSQSYAARAGRWSAQHRRKAIFGWLAFVIAAVAIGGMVGTKHPKQAGSDVGDSSRADRIISEHFPKLTTESVLIQGAAARSPEVRAAVGEIVARVSRLPAVSHVRSPFAAGNAGQVSKDGRSVLVRFRVKGDEDAAKAVIDPIEEAVASVGAAHPSVRVGEFGGASASKALSKAFQDDFKKAETLSLPITLVILILAFGALVAAGIPVLLALSAVGATLGLVALPSHVVALDEMISSIVLLIGMAVGVDYTLFYLRREREERRRGRSSGEAIAIAAATSGRAVLVSGLTVMAAMAGLFFAGDRTFVALGLGAIMVVAVAMIGSVTVVPALLAALGDKAEKGRIPFLHRGARGARDGDAAAGGSRAWGWILGKVLARPLVSTGLATAVLVALAVPAFSMHTANTGIDGLPRKLEVMQVYDRMQAAFPGGQIPATVVVEARDVRAPRMQAAVSDLERRALATGHMKQPVGVSVSRDHRVATIDVPIIGNGSDARSNLALADLRERIIPATLTQVPGAKAYVTGMTAGSKDFNDLMKRRAPIVFAFVLALAFVLLLVTFRSIVIPIKAIVLNLLSVGASYGVLVEVFQKGHGEKLLSFTSSGSVTSWLPMFLFVILFGLSMDYHVFIISRIREAFDRGLPTEDAVAEGIRSTAGTVTSAAAVMVAVFAIFATLSAIDFKMMGVGLAVAILVDATVVRAVLLPATMKVLGDWNWYLPQRLSWLPKLDHEPEPEPARG